MEWVRWGGSVPIYTRSCSLYIKSTGTYAPEQVALLHLRASSGQIRAKTMCTVQAVGNGCCGGVQALCMAPAASAT